jgi:cell division septation protein DedD
MKALIGGFVLGMLLAAPGPTEAQGSGGDLSRAERLVDEGRFAQARQILEGWWNDRQRSASRQDLQTAIWLRAVLTVDPDMADLDYRRLVVEFPGGAHSDDALLRLSRGAEARGDLPAARRYLSILVRDYPESPHRPEARALLARLPDHGDEIRDAVATGQVDHPAPGASPGSPRSGPRSGEQEPAVARAPEPEVREAPVPEAREDGLETPELAPYAVQLGAFSTAERAEDLVRQLRAEGLQVRIVRTDGSDLFRVRLGGFRTRDAASDRAVGIRDMGFEATISSDRDRERPNR